MCIRDRDTDCLNQSVLWCTTVSYTHLDVYKRQKLHSVSVKFVSNRKFYFELADSMDCQNIYDIFVVFVVAVAAICYRMSHYGLRLV